MEEKEEWAPVLGYESSYLVSNLGRIKSLIGRTRQPDNMVKQKYMSHIGKKISPEDLEKYHYYKQAILWNTELKRTMTYSVHRMVWEAFYGKISDGLQVNHINEIKDDNRLSNLNLMTAKENINWGTAHTRSAEKKTHTLSDMLADLKNTDTNMEYISGYVNCSTKCRFKCSICGREAEVNPTDVIRKSTGCRVCSTKRVADMRRYNKSDAQAVLDSKFNKNIGIVNYNGSMEVCTFICNTCGDVFERIFNNERQRKGNGCGKCERLDSLTNQFEKAKTKLNDRFDGNIIFTDTKYAGSHKQSHFKCLTCGTKFVKSYNKELVLHGNGHPRCPKTK